MKTDWEEVCHQTCGQVWEQVEDQLKIPASCKAWSQVRPQVWEQVEDHVKEYLWSQVEHQIRRSP